MSSLHGTGTVLALVTLALSAHAAPETEVARAGATPPAPTGSVALLPEDTEATAFATQCLGCHTIGGGDQQGPDLLPATQWSPDQLRGAIKLMEKRVGPLSDDAIGAFIGLLRDPEVKTRVNGAQRALLERTTSSSSEPPSPEVGAALFWGDRPLTRGGLACATCHRAAGRGGTLGPDLTDLALRTDPAALLPAVQSASFNVMRSAYRDHPISKQEGLHLTAYLQSIAGTPQNAFGKGFLLGGLALGALWFGSLIWVFRPRPGARAALQRQARQK